MENAAQYMGQQWVWLGLIRSGEGTQVKCLWMTWISSSAESHSVAIKGFLTQTFRIYSSQRTCTWPLICLIKTCAFMCKKRRRCLLSPVLPVFSYITLMVNLQDLFWQHSGFLTGDTFSNISLPAPTVLAVIVFHPLSRRVCVSSWQNVVSPTF